MGKEGASLGALSHTLVREASALPKYPIGDPLKTLVDTGDADDVAGRWLAESKRDKHLLLQESFRGVALALSSLLQKAGRLQGR